jgi:hypothetical protein
LSQTYGSDEYQVEAMIAAVDASGQPVQGLLPVGPGTVFEIHGKVQLFGNTIEATGDDPLVFVVHNARNREDTKASWVTSGGLLPLRFKLNAGSPRRLKPGQPFLQLVHMGGKGVATLKDGTQTVFQ